MKSKLEQLMYENDFISIDLYLSEISTEQFKVDVMELIRECRDFSGLDKAILALQEVKRETEK